MNNVNFGFVSKRSCVRAKLYIESCKKLRCQIKQRSLQICLEHLPSAYRNCVLKQPIFCNFASSLQRNGFWQKTFLLLTDVDICSDIRKRKQKAYTAELVAKTGLIKLPQGMKAE